MRQRHKPAVKNLNDKHVLTSKHFISKCAIAIQMVIRFKYRMLHTSVVGDLQ